MPYTVIKAEIPYPLMWDKAGWLPLRLGGKEYEIAFERTWRPGIKGMELKYDRLGRLSYTNIAVRFPHASSGDGAKQMIGIAHKVINRLLDVYRVATKESHIGHIPIQELGAAEGSHGTYVVEDDGTVREHQSIQFDLGAGLSMSPTMAIDSHAMLDLEFERPLSVVDVLLLNARRSALFEEYRGAVIEAETAFEVGVDRSIARHLLSKTTTSSEGHTVAAYSREHVNILLGAGLKNLLKDHLPTSIGKEFLGTPDHIRWERDLYALRNAVVHDGAEVQSDEAELALEAAEHALVYVGAIMPQLWPATDRLNQMPQDSLEDNDIPSCR